MMFGGIRTAGSQMSARFSEIATAKSTHRQGGGHQLEHTAPIGWHRHRIRQQWKFLRCARNERRIIRQFFKTAPLPIYR